MVTARESQTPFMGGRDRYGVTGRALETRRDRHGVTERASGPGNEGRMILTMVLVSA
jgi:hypothetical protein